MSQPQPFARDKNGRFQKKSKVKWKENLRAARQKEAVQNAEERQRAKNAEQQQKDAIQDAGQRYNEAVHVAEVQYKDAIQNAKKIYETSVQNTSDKQTEIALNVKEKQNKIALNSLERQKQVAENVLKRQKEIKQDAEKRQNDIAQNTLDRQKEVAQNAEKQNKISQTVQEDSQEKLDHILSSIAHDHNYLANVNEPHTVQSEEVVSTEKDSQENNNPSVPSTTSDHKIICDVALLGDKLDRCNLCDMPLRLSQCARVKYQGLGSYLYINCDNVDCKAVNRVPTSKQHRPPGKTRGPMVWDLNTKAATAMLHVGLGETGVNNFLSTLNVHCINKSTLKERETEVGDVIERLAEESMTKALHEELEATIRSEDEEELEDLEEVTPDLGSVSDPLPSLTEKSTPNQIPTSTSIPESANTPVPSPICNSNVNPKRTVSNNDVSDSGYESSTSPANPESPVSAEGGVSGIQDGSSSDSGYETTTTNNMAGFAKQKAKCRWAQRRLKRARKIKASADGAWQRRASGRAWNSLTGHASLMGVRTRKVIGLGVKSKRCLKCSRPKRKNKTPKPHKCGKNHTGSAKSMEAAIVVELLKDCKEKGVPVGELVGDDDTTTIAKARLEVDSEIKKASDKNHVTKNVGKELYEIKPKHPELTVKAILYLKRLFGYALAQNKGNEEGMKKALKAVTSHPFNDHTHCSGQWCKFNEDPEGFKFKGIRKALTSHILRKDIEKIFDLPADKLCNLASSNMNESLNNSATQKAAKRVFLGNSYSLNYRLKATALQKNEGYTYPAQVHEALLMSPSRGCISRGKKIDAKNKRKAEIAGTREAKRRRLQLKRERNNDDEVKEIREGDTYESNIGMKKAKDLCRAVPAPVPAIPDGGADEEPTEIPDPLVPLEPEQIPDEIKKNGTLVFFDMETNGFGVGRDILQIAAITENKVFNKYMTPTKPIPLAVQEVTNITYSKGKLKYNKQLVEAVSQSEGVSEFINFVSSIEKPIIVGHNIKCFDIPRLYDKLSPSEKEMFEKHVSAFVDTLPLFRGLHPELEKHTQTFLVPALLGETYTAHNALDDAQALKKLVLQCTSRDQRAAYLFTPVDVQKQKDRDEEIAKNLETMSHLVGKGNALSCNMAKTIAASGMRLGHITLALKRGGVDGLAKVFREETLSGEPRVTKKGLAVAKKIAKVVQV